MLKQARSYQLNDNYHPGRQLLPDICDDDDVFTISLMTVEVGKAHLHFQIHKLHILHLGLPVRGEVATLCPLYGGPAQQMQIKYICEVTANTRPYLLASLFTQLK